MRRSLLNQRRLLLLAIAALFVASQLPVAWTSWAVDAPHYIVDTSIQPSSHLVTLLGNRVNPEPIDAQQKDLETLNKERDDLWRMNQFLMQQLREAHEELALMRQITVQLGLDRPPAMLAASVTAVDRQSGGTLLTINRGSQHDLRTGLTVAVGPDLVGEVSKVGPLTATVTLITRADQSFEAHVAPPDTLNPGEGVSHLYLRYSRDDRGFVTSVPIDANVQEGHYAISQRPRGTSGFIIGRVTEVLQDPEQPMLKRKLIIRPRFDLVRVDRVIIVIPQEDEPTP